MIKRSGPCRTRRRLRGALAGEASAGDLGVALEDALTDPSPSHFYANLGLGVLLFDAGATVKELGVWEEQTMGCRDRISKAPRRSSSAA
jgi:glycosyltransferase A (GT-A) superfamily protein (DUF2064 family)